MVRTNQGGSILGFVIIGGVMALLLVGGAYLVRHNLAPASDSEPVAVEESGSASETQEEEAAKPEDDEPDVVDDHQQHAEEEPKNEQPSQTEAGADSPEHLPQTGPADVLIGGLLLGSITGVSIAYKRSRDALSSL